MLFDSEVSDKDFICQQAINHVRNARRACSSPDAHNRIITDFPWTVTVDIPAIDFTWYAEVEIREALIVREPDGMTPVFFCGVTLKDCLEEAIKQSLLQMTESLAKNDKQGVYMMNVRTSDGLMRQCEEAASNELAAFSFT